MAIDRTVVEKKLGKINEFIRLIEEMEFDEQDYAQNVDIQDLLAFRLMECVELATDVATHIVSAAGLTRPDTQKGVFLLLGEKKYLSEKVAKAMANAVGFRNLVVHEYDDPAIFDPKQVYSNYKDDLADLKRFCAEVVEMLEKR